jgi:hypothetical protein
MSILWHADNEKPVIMNRGVTLHTLTCATVFISLSLSATVYQLQQKAPKPNCIPCRKQVSLVPSPGVFLTPVLTQAFPRDFFWQLWKKPVRVSVARRKSGRVHDACDIALVFVVMSVGFHPHLPPLSPSSFNSCLMHLPFMDKSEFFL